MSSTQNTFLKLVLIDFKDQKDNRNLGLELNFLRTYSIEPSEIKG